jgi:hypothetical protein
LERRQHQFDNDYDNHATPRPTIYWCSPTSTEKYLATIKNPTSTSKMFQLPVASYGILNIGNTNNLKQDAADLRRELTHQFNWNKLQVPYLGDAKNEVRKVKMGPNSAAIFFQSLAHCANQLHPDFKYGNASEFVVATEPFRFELPNFGNIPDIPYQSCTCIACLIFLNVSC